LKKIVYINYLLLAILLCIIACGTTGTLISGPILLDDAIRLASENIHNNIVEGYKIALLNFSSPSDYFSEYVLEELSDRLVEGKKLVVVTRNELDLIRQEEEFQMSGEVSDESAQSIGKKLGAQVIVTGSLTSIGRTYRFRIRVLNVETAVIMTSPSSDLNPNEEKIKYLLAGSRPVLPVDTAQPIIAMVRIKGGTFEMGNDYVWSYDEPRYVTEDDTRPVHSVRITGFYMGKYEVTQREWTFVMGNNPSSVISDNFPVDHVSWYDAIEFCNELSLKEGLIPVYTIDKNKADWLNNSEDDNLKWTIIWNRRANGYRLPTEAEWEYAARGGNGSPGNYLYSGSNDEIEVGWTFGNSLRSLQEVGGLKPNSLGLYDMTGNVSEWCWDWYDENTYSSRPFIYNLVLDPLGEASGTHRVIRGGSAIYCGWSGGDPHECYSSARAFSSPSNRESWRQIGIRVVRNL